MQVVSSRRLNALLVCGAAIICIGAEPAIAQSSSKGSGSRRVQPGLSSRPVQQGSSSRSSGSGNANQNSGFPRKQGSSSRRSGGRRSFEAKLWSYLQAQKYKNWAPVPGQSDAAYPGQSPHGAFLNMYLNRTAAGNPNLLPDRSIIIKENLAEDAKTLGAITVMYRSKGYNPVTGTGSSTTRMAQSPPHLRISDR